MLKATVLLSGLVSATLLLATPVSATAQSSFDTSGYRFRNDAQTPLYATSANKDYVFRNDQQQAGGSGDAVVKSNAIGNYRFRPPRQPRTLTPKRSSSASDAACFAPAEQASANSYRPYTAPSYQQGYQSLPFMPAPLSGQSPYLNPGYQGSTINPGNFMPGNNSYFPGGSFPRW